MQKGQLSYNPEPAGNHEVRGIDHYHSLPFVLGASELINNNLFTTPLSIHTVPVLIKAGITGETVL
jgi:hypothetical protein